MWNLSKYGENIALYTNDQEISYNELDAISQEIALHYKDRSLIFILASNTKGSLAGYVAAINSRTVPLMLDANMDHELFFNLMGIYKPQYIWAPDDYDYSYESEAKEVCHLWEYKLIETKYHDKAALSDELALLITTSGSTGSPKLVKQSYKNLLSNTESIIEYLNITSSERAITTLPMNYVYGLSIINTHLYAGASIILTELGMLQRDFWRLFKEKGATSFGGVPYTYEMLDKMRIYNMDLPSLKTVTQAGGKLSITLHHKLAKWAAEKGISFVVMYGASEATARMGYLPADKAVEKEGSMGIAIPGGRFELRTLDGEIIDQPGVEGELVYYGNNVTLGYAQKAEDLALGDERNGVLHTGDMARFDEDGYFYIVGRLKRFVKIVGKRINLDEAEQLLKNRFPSTDIVCAGNDVKIIIFTTDDKYRKEAESFLAEKLGINKLSVSSRVLSDIPKNGAGKIQYKELEKYYAE